MDNERSFKVSYTDRIYASTPEEAVQDFYKTLKHNLELVVQEVEVVEVYTVFEPCVDCDHNIARHVEVYEKDEIFYRCSVTPCICNTHIPYNRKH